MDQYAQDIRAIRTDRVLTQAQFAELADVDVTTVRRWESGKRRPTLSSLNAIKEGLNRLGKPLSDGELGSIIPSPD